MQYSPAHLIKLATQRRELDTRLIIEADAELEFFQFCHRVTSVDRARGLLNRFRIASHRTAPHRRGPNIHHRRRATGAGAGVGVGAMPAIRIWQQPRGNPDGDV